MSIMPERKDKIDLFRKYISIPAVITAAKDSDVKVMTKEDLAGKVPYVHDSTIYYN